MSINSIGTNIPIEVTKGGLGTASLTQYGVLYGNGTAAVGVTAVGTAGQVLTSNGAGVAPTFQNSGVVPGSGAWTFIQTLTAANSASLIFNSGLSASYPNLVFIVDNILSTSLNDAFLMDVSINGGGSFVGMSSNVNYTNTSTGTWATTSTARRISPPFILTSGPGYSAVLYYMNANVSSNANYVNGTFVLPISGATAPYMGNCVGSPSSGATQTVNAFRFAMTTGNIASGSITLYGIRNS